MTKNLSYFMRERKRKSYYGACSESFKDESVSFKWKLKYQAKE